MTLLLGNERLVDSARRLGGHASDEEAVLAALREYVQRREGVSIFELAPEVEYDPEYDYKAQRRRDASSVLSRFEG